MRNNSKPVPGLFAEDGNDDVFDDGGKCKCCKESTFCQAVRAFFSQVRIYNKQYYSKHFVLAVDSWNCGVYVSVYKKQFHSVPLQIIDEENKTTIIIRIVDSFSPL